eukprot:5336619-Lingulodinium_polyedra.AAC.1
MPRSRFAVNLHVEAVRWRGGRAGQDRARRASRRRAARSCWPPGPSCAISIDNASHSWSGGRG